jgi:hypothetical protein
VKEDGEFRARGNSSTSLRLGAGVVWCFTRISHTFGLAVAYAIKLSEGIERKVSGTFLPLVRHSTPATPGQHPDMAHKSRRPVHHSHIPRARNIGLFVARVHAQNVSGRHWCWPCSIHCNPCAAIKCACITLPHHQQRHRRSLPLC